MLSIAKYIYYGTIDMSVEVAQMVEYFEVKKAEQADAVEKIVSAWRENLHALEKAHPRVFRKVKQEILAYTGEEFVQGLIKLAGELLERHKRNKALQSVKIAITYNKYVQFYHGSLVKLYFDGSVTYNSRATIEGYRFIIHNGVEVY